MTSTALDANDGPFMLGYLPQGTYSVAVTDTAGLSFVTDDVGVVPGSNQDLGTITLQ